MQNHYTTPQELAALHKRGAQCLDGPVPGRWPGRSTARRSGSAALAVSCPICDTIVIMARTKRFQLTLQNGSKLSALKDWMERDIPVRLTLSQVADAAIEIVHKVATSTTSRIVHIPTFERGVQALILRGTVQTTGRIIAGFGMDVDIKATPDGKIVATRLADQKTVSDQVFREDEQQVREAARLAEELQKIQLRISEIEQSLNTFLGYEGPPELAPPFIDKPPPEVEALVTERTALKIRRAAIVAEGEEEARLADEHNRTQKQDYP